MKRTALTALLLVLFAVSTHAQTTAGTINEEKKQDLIRLLDLTKATDIGAQFVQQGVDELRKSFASLPDERRERMVKIFQEEMLKEFSREKMIEGILPIYDKYLTDEDVKQLIAFYESPVGRKMVEVQPRILKEAFDYGSTRGREAGQRAVARITEEGLLEPPPDVEKLIRTPTLPAKKRPAARRRRGLRQRSRKSRRQG